MQMESQVMSGSPQNIFGVSWLNNIAAFSETTEVDWDLLCLPVVRAILVSAMSQEHFGGFLQNLHECPL